MPGQDCGLLPPRQIGYRKALKVCVAPAPDPRQYRLLAALSEAEWGAARQLLGAHCVGIVAFTNNVRMNSVSLVPSTSACKICR